MTFVRNIWLRFFSSGNAKVIVLHARVTYTPIRAPYGPMALWTLWPFGPFGSLDPMALWALWPFGPYGPLDPYTCRKTYDELIENNVYYKK